MQASQKEELGHLERTVARMGGLEKELAKEKDLKARLTQAKETLEQELKGLREELEKK